MALPPILVELKANSASFVAGMKEAQHEVQKLGTGSSANLAKFGAVGKAALFGIAGAAVGIGAVSLKMGADFQSAMELIHTQAGASQAEVDKMSKAVLGLAGKTATAPNELAAGLYHLESSGLRGAKALEALKVAAEGAKVGHANLEDVTNAMNAVIASGIPGAQNMTKAMGMLNATVGAGDMRMQDLADAMGTGLLAGVKGFGLNLRDVGAALATFGDNNIRGADAATQLRLAVQFMAKPAKGAADEFKKFGMTTDTLGKDMRTGGLSKAITDLHDHLDKAGIKGNEVGKVLLDAFGKKAGVGIGVLLEQYSRFQSKLEEVHTGSKNFGADWNATQETMAFKTQKLGAEAEALGVKIGLALIPVLEKLAVDVMAVVDWFEKHSTIAKILAVAVGTVLVVAITAYAVAMASAAVATIAATWPILAIIAAVAAVGVGIYELATHWHQVWGAISSFMSTVGHEILHVLETWGPLALAVLVPFLGIPLLIATHWRQIVNFVEKVWQDALSAIKTVAGDIVTFVKGIPGMILGALGDLDHLLVDAGKRVIGGFVHGIEGAAGDVKGALGHLTSKLTSWKGPPEKDRHILFPAGQLVIQGFVDGIESMTAKVKEALGRVTVQGHDLMFAGGKAVGDALIQGLSSVEAKLNTKFAGIVSQLASVKSAAAQMASGITSSLAGAAGFSNIKAPDNSAQVTSLQQQLAAAQNTPALQLQGQMQGQLDQAKQSLFAAQFTASPDEKAIGSLNDTISSLTDELTRVATAAAPDSASVASLQQQLTAAQNPAPDTSAGGVATYLQSSLAALQQFQGDMSTLKDKGLSADQLNQIAQMGVTKGDQYAQSFLGASADQIAQLNKLDTQVLQVSAGIGTLVSNDTFGREISALTAQEKQAADEITAIKHVIAELLAETKKKKAGELHVHIEGNVYGVTSKEFARDVKKALLELRRTSGQSLGFT